MRNNCNATWKGRPTQTSRHPYEHCLACELRISLGKMERCDLYRLGRFRRVCLKRVNEARREERKA